MSEDQKRLTKIRRRIGRPEENTGKIFVAEEDSGVVLKNSSQFGTNLIVSSAVDYSAATKIRDFEIQAKSRELKLDTG